MPSSISLVIIPIGKNRLRDMANKLVSHKKREVIKSIKETSYLNKKRVRFNTTVSLLSYKSLNSVNNINCEENQSNTFLRDWSPVTVVSDPDNHLGTLFRDSGSRELNHPISLEEYSRLLPIPRGSYGSVSLLVPNLASMDRECVAEAPLENNNFCCACLMVCCLGRSVRYTG